MFGLKQGERLWEREWHWENMDKVNARQNQTQNLSLDFSREESIIMLRENKHRRRRGKKKKKTKQWEEGFCHVYKARVHTDAGSQFIHSESVGYKCPRGGFCKQQACVTH